MKGTKDDLVRLLDPHNAFRIAQKLSHCLRALSQHELLSAVASDSLSFSKVSRGLSQAQKVPQGPCTFLRQSNDGVVLDDRVLDDHHNAILDHEALIFSVALGHALLVDDLDIRADARVLVDDALSHSAPWACIDQNPMKGSIMAMWVCCEPACLFWRLDMLKQCQELKRQLMSCRTVALKSEDDDGSLSQHKCIACGMTLS